MKLAEYKTKIVNRYRDFATKYEDYVDPAWEFLTVYIISNVPFIALILMHLAGTKGALANLETIYNVIAENVKSGEILIYVSALLAPFVYIMIQYHRARRHFPLYGFFLLMTAGVYTYCLLVFSMYRLDRIKNLSFVSETSVYFYGAALVLWYFSLVFQRKLQKRPIIPEISGAQHILDGLGGKK